MKRQLPALAALAGLVVACSGSAAPTESSTEYAKDALVTLKTESSGLEVEVRTLPSQPPVLGNSTVQLIVRDPTSAEPESGLDIQAVPWMPAMGHGSSVTPTVTETAPGTYELTGVVMFMPGTWQLRTTFTGPVADHVVPSFQVR